MKSLLLLIVCASTFCFASMSLYAAPKAPKKPSSPKPNIIFVMADDLGYGDIGVYNSSSKISMINLTQLSQEGMTFTDAHSSAAVCAPSRYSTITGNYQWRGRYEWGAWQYYHPSQILPGQLTVGDVLQSAGYRTSFFGKFHLGGSFYMKDFDAFAALESEIDFFKQFEDGPLDHGFDYSFLIPAGVQGPPYAFFENDTLVGDPNSLIEWSVGMYGDSRIAKTGIGVPSWDTTEIGETMVAKVTEFIDGHLQANVTNGTDTPFFVYFTPSAPHYPWTPPISLLGTPVRGETGLNNRSDMIYEFDVTIGKIMEAISVRGLERDTLVVVTSDNGGENNWELTLGHDSTGGLRGEKGEIWEGGHRVPLIIKWGDGTSEGSVVQPDTFYNELIALNDLTATVAALVGSPLSTEQARDSYNFLSVLLGTTSPNAPVRDSMIQEARRDIVTGDWGGLRRFAFRKGPWKLVMDDAGNPLNLFNLDLDLYETIDLINEADQDARIFSMQDQFNTLRFASRTAPVLNIDMDGDGLSDAQEYFLGSDQNNPDTDGDGVADNLDNCILVANGPLIPDADGNIQRDTDGDGYGNVCDADLNQDLQTDLSDFSLFRSVFATEDPDADFNGDGSVDLTDFSLFRAMFGSPPGPSGLNP